MHHDLEQRGSLSLRLRELPDDAHQPYDFREFQLRAAQRTLAARDRRDRRLLVAAAAITATALTVLLRFGSPPPRVAPGGATAGDVAAPQAAPPVLPTRPDVTEHWLTSLPRDPALVRVGARAAVSGLEDRIAQLDDQLSVARIEPNQAGRLDALQQERLRLMGALVQVRYAETLADSAR